MKKITMTTLALAALPLLANTPPEITNVRASQRENTKLVDVYYDAADADGDLLKVRIDISDNDGATYAVPAFTFSGDIGDNVKIGTNKHIVWDAGTDWNGEYSDQMRVKIYAIDANGLPGLEWGNEVASGGFLMGQDGGVEGSGESRHVCIPWSYWLSKYEITCWEYCQFLNRAYSAGYVELSGVKKALATTNMPADFACKASSELCDLGDDKNIRWNINKFEPSTSLSSNLPASVTWFGAMAFARFYGYDLPTEAEWERAARGPNNDDQDEHLLFPWGNEISASYANITPSSLKPVGYYDGNQTPLGPDMVNGYGLYDVIGNACEWTLSRSEVNYDSSTKEVSYSGITEYPLQENLLSRTHNPFNGSTRVVRGYADNPLYYRQVVSTDFLTLKYLTGYTYYGSSYSGYSVPNYQDTKAPIGFRVIRRGGVNPTSLRVAYTETFDDWEVMTIENASVTNETTAGCWILDGTSYHTVGIAENYINNTRCVRLSSNAKLYMPVPEKQVISLSLKVKTTNSSYNQFWLVAVANDGKTTSTTISYNDDSSGIHALKMDFPDIEAKACYIYSYNSSYIDDVQVITISE